MWNKQPLAVAALLFIGVLCHALQLPFMPFYIVEILEKSPWHIALYTAILTPITLVVNRAVAGAMDRGLPPSRYLPIPLVAYLAACAAILLVQPYEAKLILAALLFGIAGSGPTTLFSYARLYAEQRGLEVARFNAFLRATNSFAWMIGPALAFGLVSIGSASTVFVVALGLGTVWAGGIASVVRIGKMHAENSDSVPSLQIRPEDRLNLLLAVIACWLISVAHSITAGALPLFVVREALLPTFAPGLSFAVKTFVEIFAILSTPYLIKRLGERNGLMISCGFAILAFLILMNVSSLAVLILGAAVEGLYYGLFAGIGITYIQNLSGTRVARGTALYMNSLIVGSLVSGPAVGIIAEAADFRSAIQASLLAAAAAFFVLWRIKNEVRPT